MRYWVYVNGEVPGSYNLEELASLPGFSMTTLVCPAQGEISEKNWRRAGEFEDIARALAVRTEPATPPPPALSDVDSMLNTASSRLFSHVADLMKELENRREERALTSSLQRQILALKEELSQTRERSNMLEVRLPRIAELEEQRRKDAAELQALHAGQRSQEGTINEMRVSLEKLRGELDAAKRRLVETQNDLAMRNRLVDKLSKELSDKELSLAKSLGLIRRLEEDLNRLCPEGLPSSIPEVSPHAEAPVAAEVTPPSPLAAETLPPAAASPSAEDGPFTTDEPPPTPPYLEPSPNDRPSAHQALVGFFRRIFPGSTH